MTNEELATAIQQGHDELKPKLWHNIEKWCAVLAYRFYNRNRDFCARCGLTADDLRQQGYFGFEYSLRTYSADKGAYLPYFSFAYKSAVRTLFKRSDVLNRADTESIETSEESSRGDELPPLSETIPDDQSEEPFENVETGGLCAFVREVVGTLPERERDTIEYVYFNGGTLKTAGERAGVSWQCCAQRIKDGLRRLRKRPDVLKIANEYGYNSRKAMRNSLGAFQRHGMTGVEAVAMYRADHSGTARDFVHSSAQI